MTSVVPCRRTCGNKQRRNRKPARGIKATGQRPSSEPQWILRSFRYAGSPGTKPIRPGSTRVPIPRNRVGPVDHGRAVELLAAVAGWATTESPVPKVRCRPRDEPTPKCTSALRSSECTRLSITLTETGTSGEVRKNTADAHRFGGSRRSDYWPVAFRARSIRWASAEPRWALSRALRNSVAASFSFPWVARAAPRL
jgi:hypothetical protein